VKDILDLYLIQNGFEDLESSDVQCYWDEMDNSNKKEVLIKFSQNWLKVYLEK